MRAQRKPRTGVVRAELHLHSMMKTYGLTEHMEQLSMVGKVFQNH